MSGDELERQTGSGLVAGGGDGLGGLDGDDGGAPAIEAVAAGLRRDGADLSLYGGFLINTLTEALPEDLLRIERKRSASDRLRGRDGEIVGVSVDLGDHRFALTRAGVGARPQTTVAHVSGGITMSTSPVALDDWAGQLAAALVAAAGRDAAAADAAARLSIPRGSDL
jgi:hypothetical protein